MIQVGIVGSVLAIRKHIHAIKHLTDISIKGRWITEGEQDTAYNPDTGISHLSPFPLTENVDVLIIAEGNSFSRRLAVAALRSARHVFINNSAIPSVNEALQLQKLAREANVILRVGKTGNAHLHGLTEKLPDLTEISMIELSHHHHISGNGTGTSIRDALLADLEIITSLVKARVISIKAKGLCMLYDQPDVVNVRLEFDNGCAVSYNCNLVSPQDEFGLTLMLNNRMLKFDFINRKITNWSLRHQQHPDYQLTEMPRRAETDVLTDDLGDFFSLIRSGTAFLSAGDCGFEPYMLTDRILEKVMKTLVRCS